VSRKFSALDAPEEKNDIWNSVVAKIAKRFTETFAEDETSWDLSFHRGEKKKKTQEIWEYLENVPELSPRPFILRREFLDQFVAPPRLTKIPRRENSSFVFLLPGIIE